MAFTDFNQVISFDDFFEDRPTLVMQKSGLVLEENMKDLCVTPQSHNLFYSDGELSSILTTQGSQIMDPNFNANTSHVDTDEWDLLKHEKSPWHESDSGVSSDMSDTGSPAWCSDIPKNETAIMPTVEWPELGNEADDLTAYILGTDISITNNGSEADCLKDQQNLNNSSHDELKTLSVYTGASGNFVAPQKSVPPNINDDIDVDEENSDSEFSNCGAVSPDLHNSQISHPLNFFKDICKDTKKKPAVKIVKVLKSANPDCCDDDIVKALDERSRKNAIQAKMNREKKKKYVSSLEHDVEKLGQKNKELQDENTKLKKDVNNLEEEVRYLKSVLVNASALSGMLRNISGVSEVKLSANIVGKKREASDYDDHSYTAIGKVGDNGRAEHSAKTKRARLASENVEKAGVCLHVNGEEASLEFCAKCSSLARRSQSQSRKS